MLEICVNNGRKNDVNDVNWQQNLVKEKKENNKHKTTKQNFIELVISIT